MFPTDFIIDLRLQLNPKYGQFESLPAKLSCKEKEYKLTFFPDGDLEDALSMIVNDFIWGGKLSSIFKLSECKIVEEDITLISDKIKINGIHVSFDMTTKIRTWEIGLNNVLFKKKGSIEELTDASIRKLYLLNYGPNIIAELPMKDFSNESIEKDLRLKRKFTYRDSDIEIGYDSDVKYPFLIIYNYSLELLYEVLALISFYYFKPIKQWLCIKKESDWVEYEFTSPFVAHERDADKISQWDFYSIDGNRKTNISLELIFDSASNAISKNSQLFHDVLFRSLQTHVDILNDSEQSQFIFYTSILLTIAEKIHMINKPATQSVKKLFKLAKIRFDKIDDEQNRLQSHHFQRTKVLEDRKGCLFFFHRKKHNFDINTFIDLRNEFIHGLPTPEMLAYIHDSLLLPKLKHCVFLIILYELGINARYSYHVNILNVQK